ncbi:MAG: putative Ig domain-containing protein [Xanthomonadales bacterium]|nr:putative Ig domain-containing protein [Xanthomonadales bacterium]
MYTLTRKPLSRYERLLSVVTMVRPGEGTSVARLSLLVFMLMTASYLLKPVRDTLILSQQSAEIRSYLVALTAGLLILIIPVYGALYRRYLERESKCLVLRGVAAFFTVTLAGFIAASLAGLQIAVAFFVWYGVFAVMMLAQFWAFAADLFNVKSGQRLFVAFAVAASLGAWFGAQLAEGLFSTVGATGLMTLAAVLIGLSPAVAAIVEPKVPEASRSVPYEEEQLAQPTLLGGFSVLATNRYLIAIAVFMVLLNWVNSTGEFILASYVKRAAAAVPVADQEAFMAAFYGDYLAWVTLIGLAVQLFLVSRIFSVVGVRGALLILPSVMLLGYGLMWFVPVLSVIRLAAIFENSVNYSIQNTTTQALYLPLNRQAKYEGKTIIDTFFWRTGDLIQGGVVFLGTQVMGVGPEQFILFNLALSLVFLMVAVGIGRKHRRVLRENVGNVAPQMISAIPDVTLPAGQKFSFDISQDTFVDADPGDALHFRATTDNGAPLPRWIRFDRLEQRFQGIAPNGQYGKLDVSVVVTDFEGLSVSGKFTVEYTDNNDDPVDDDN